MCPAANFYPQVEAAGAYLFPQAYNGAEALKKVRDTRDPGIPGVLKLVIAWFNHDLTDLGNALAAFAPQGSLVTVICANKLGVRACHACFHHADGVPWASLIAA